MKAAGKYFEDALSLVEANPQCASDTAFVTLLADMSYVLTMMFHPRKLSQLVEQYRHRIDRLGDRAAKVIVLANYSFAADMTCQYGKALVVAEKALEIALRLDDARAKAYARGAIMCANTLLCQGDFEQMQHHAQLGALESDQTDDAYLQAWVRLNAAWIFLYRGVPDRGRALAFELQERGRRLADPRAASFGLWILGWLDIVDEQYEDALIHGSECIELAITPFDREIGHQVRGVAEIFRGNASRGAIFLRDHRERAMANDFNHCRAGIDPPLGIAMAPEGDFAATNSMCCAVDRRSG